MPSELAQKFRHEFINKKVVKYVIGHCVFFSKLDIESKKFGKYHIDARPSDAIAIAIRINAPILVSNKIIDNLSPQLITTFEPSHESDDKKALKTLKLKLENAVKNERYEVAANLRDKIKKIEG